MTLDEAATTADRLMTRIRSRPSGQARISQMSEEYEALRMLIQFARLRAELASAPSNR